MATDVTFVNDNSNANVVESTDDIIVTKVFSNNILVKALNRKYFATLTSYNTNKATLVSESVEILD
jgi:hypothetical protein